MRLARRPLLAGAGLGLLLGQRLAAAAEAVRGSGRVVTQRREIGAFRGVALGAPFTVVLRAAEREAIEIAADDNLLPLIETRLHGSGGQQTLQIELPRGVRVEPSKPVRVTVDYVRLEQLAVGGAGAMSARSLKSDRLSTALGGSGSIELVELDAGALSIDVGGSGALQVDGRAGTVSISVAGSGRCDAERLVAEDVSVSLAGSGSARVRAERRLQASVAGSGDLRYGGAATPQVSIVGSGRVRRL